jgi:uncharacterized protein (TIGR02646 family)
MKYIEKKPEGLPVLEQWVNRMYPSGVPKKKKTPAEIWKGFRKRGPYKELVATLLQEQGYLCAYCGRAIGEIDKRTRAENVKELKEILDEKQEKYDVAFLESTLFAGESKSVEHVISKGKQRDVMFDYPNLVVVCDGARHTDDEHCDAHKAHNESEFIKIKPTDADCESYFIYEDGEITSSNSDATETIKALNLNAERLKRGRKKFTIEKVQAFVEELYQLEIEAESIKQLIKNEIQEAYSKPKLEPYCFVKVYYFRTYLT